MKKITQVFMLLVMINLLGCNKQTEQALPDSPAVAIVGDEAVSLDLLKAFLQANGVTQSDKETMQKALEVLTKEVALAENAKKEKTLLTTLQLNTLKYLKIKALANNARQAYLAGIKVTDDEIQKEYQQAQQQVGGKQYHIHHLLFKDEVEAIKKREQIKTVEDYKMMELLYKQQHPNQKNIGDLGWVSLAQLPEGFRKPLQKAQVASVLPQVVNSKFGAHIVYFEDQREQQPPKLEEVKLGIIKSIKAKKLSRYVQLIEAKSRIKIKQ